MFYNFVYNYLRLVIITSIFIKIIENGLICSLLIEILSSVFKIFIFSRFKKLPLRRHLSISVAKMICLHLRVNDNERKFLLLPLLITSS